MTTIKGRKTQLSVMAVAALAIFAVAAVMLLAGSFTTGTAQAQRTPDDPAPAPSAAPQPCGPERDNFPENPLAVVTEGHYAMFDAYWLPGTSLDGDDSGTTTGTLNNNLCPPSAKHRDVINAQGQTVEETALSKTDIDLRTTIIQVKDKHLADVVATNALAGTTKLSLEKYKKVREALGLGKNDPVPAGTKVHWLRLEDTALRTDPSDLVMGFSTGHLDDAHWHQDGTDDDDNPLKPFQFELESVRVLGANPANLPHVLTYWEPDLGSGIVWDTTNTDVNAMPLGAGEYEHLEWVFTKPGTYVLEVHLKGHVRQENPDPTDSTWKKLDAVDETVTSVPHRYVFQVGDLHLNDQPHFGAVRSVTAGASANSAVGDAIGLFGMDADTLELNLDGVGSGDFKVTQETTAWSHGARISVAEGANLQYPGADPENPKAAYYDLHLKVSDQHDHEDNDDKEIDDIIPLRVHVQPQSGPWVSLMISDEHPRAGKSGVGEIITITAVTHGIESGWYTGDVRLFEGTGADKRELTRVDSYGNRRTTFRVQHAEPGVQRYSVVFGYDNNNPNIASKKLASGWYPVIWRK